MEDATKEDQAQSKEPTFLGKAGWVKKSTGKLLASYKDLYIHVEKTEIVVYENEDLQNCIERWDLENYDTCLELRSMFKKKNRLVLIRAPRTGNKAHDIKFQAQSPEEKDAWIKALCDGINRAKNKVFDEVKVDGSNLEHVTRSRPKANRNRRPPTRIHMKEVANLSSDGILRLDLDFTDATMANGTHCINVDASDIPKEAMKHPTPPSNPCLAIEEHPSGSNAEEEPEMVTKLSSQINVLQPPMLPSKDAKPVTAPDKDHSRENPLRVLPSSEEEMSSIVSAEVSTFGSSSKAICEKSLKDKNKTEPPAIPPNKPTRSPTDQNSEVSQIRLETGPPTSSSKNKKSSQSTFESKQEVVRSKVCDTINKNKQREVEIEKKKEVPDMVYEMKLSPLITNEAPLGVKEELMINNSTESKEVGHPKVHKPQESAFSVKDKTPNEPQSSLQIRTLTQSVSTPELLGKSCGHRPPLNKKPHQHNTQPAQENMTIITQPQEKPDHDNPRHITSNSLDSSPHGDQALDIPTESENDFLASSLFPNDQADDATSTSAQSHHLDGEEKKRAERKSEYMCQHRGGDSEGSDNICMLASSTDSIRGIHASLDVLDIKADTMNLEFLGQVVDEEPQANAKAAGSMGQSTSIQTQSNMDFKPTGPLKPSAKIKSASTSDLLSETSSRTQIKHPSGGIIFHDGSNVHRDDTTRLEHKVTLELESTKKLLSLVCQPQVDEGLKEGKPEDLLTKAIEKLKMADHFLREVINLKECQNMKNTCKRNSW